MKLAGGCHCGTVRFEIEVEPPFSLLDCNCSICTRSGFLHLIVARRQFALLSGSDSISTYRFGTGAAAHLFCKVCGIKSFYQPRSHPEGWSVNFRCLDDVGTMAVNIVPFDGREWEKAHLALGHQAS